MDTLLTLIIALGGIATGIGAIWTALAARRQAQLTERSLTEQNERLRLNLALDLLTRLQDRFESPHFSNKRRAAANYLLDNASTDEDIVEVEHLNKAVWDVLDFFKELGYLQRIETLRAESVRNNFGWYAKACWLLCKPTLEKLRDEWQNPALYEEFEYLSHLMADIDCERGIAPPTQG